MSKCHVAGRNLDILIEVCQSESRIETVNMPKAN